MKRFRRLRTQETLRRMVRETCLQKSDLIQPIFVVEGEGIKAPIEALPGQYHFSIDTLMAEIDALEALGIHQIILFGLPNEKNAKGTSAYADQGIVQKAIRAIKAHAPHVFVITDVCLCQYTDHGHCGVLLADGQVDNDATRPLIAEVALSHVRAGADMVAPSDMMDGRIGAIRKALDGAGYVNVPIMSYALKYASSYYGPFRVAAGSAPQKGDRKAYQMDFHNKREVLAVANADIDAGADVVMVKPALAYLDHVKTLKDSVPVPVAVYNVSGEYAMLKAAIASGAVSEQIIYETMIAFKRAGADLIITYFAKEMAEKGGDYFEQ